MAGTIVAAGINVDQIVTDALAQAQGQQRSYYITQLINALGANPKARLKRDGTTVYEDVISAALAFESNALAVPDGWAGTPSINQAADIDSGSWLFEIEKATDSAVKLQLSCGPNGADTNARLSLDLDGSQIIVAQKMLLAPPTALDANVSGSDPLLTVDTLIDDMGLANDDAAYGFASWWSRPPAGQTPGFVSWGTNWDSSVQASWFKNQEGIQPWLATRYWRYPQFWMVPYIGDNHAGSNHSIQYKKFRVLGRRRDTGAWEVLRFDNNGASAGFFQAKLSNAISTGLPVASNKLAEYVEMQLLNIFDPAQVPANAQYVHHGVWGGRGEYWDESVYDCLVYGYLARMGLWNPNGVDNRDSSSCVLATAGDPYPSPEFNPGQAGNLPGHAHSRLKRVPKEWTWFTSTTLTNCRQDHNGPTAAITTQSLRSNPPPDAMMRDLL